MPERRWDIWIKCMWSTVGVPGTLMKWLIPSERRDRNTDTSKVWFFTGSRSELSASSFISHSLKISSILTITRSIYLCDTTSGTPCEVWINSGCLLWQPQIKYQTSVPRLTTWQCSLHMDIITWYLHVVSSRHWVDCFLKGIYTGNTDLFVDLFYTLGYHIFVAGKYGFYNYWWPNIVPNSSCIYD